MKPPLTETDWLKWNHILDRLDASAHDGADVYEAEAFLADLSERTKFKDPIKKMKTWIERKYGEDFDPESMCPYTGLSLFKQPTHAGIPNRAGWQWLMGYWREDGELMRVRKLTPAERDWIRDEPEQFTSDCAGFLKWLRKVRRKKAEK